MPLDIAVSRWCARADQPAPRAVWMTSRMTALDIPYFIQRGSRRRKRDSLESFQLILSNRSNLRGARFCARLEAQLLPR